MNLNRTRAILSWLLIFSLLIYSCHKNDLVKSESSATAAATEYQTAVRQPNGSLLAGSVTLNAPSTVNVNEPFNISAQVGCGKVSIERGYILASDGQTKIYKGLTCQTSNLEWEELVSFQCYTDDASWSGSLGETGTYVYRSKHNGADGNCDNLGGGNTSGQCSFSGNQFCCFVIEVINTCETSFSGEAISCSTEGRSAVFTFTSSEAQDFIKIQGGLTNFTGDDAIIEISGGNLTASQSTPGGGTNRVIKIEGSVDACETITITITWNSSNSGGIITGNWSVKDENGVEIATSVEGLTCGQ
jgi:hypothetical protein